MFRQFPWTNGVVYEESDSFAMKLSMWSEDKLRLSNSGTHFGFVHSGETLVRCKSGEFSLKAGMYFSVPGAMELVGQGRGIVATRLKYSGFFQIGGPIESIGRLRYIDGCSDSVLISPVVCGDACLNLLYIPANTNQTRHTHPSLRAGLIVSGKGTCATPQASISLVPGTVFVIPPESEHSFHTDDSDLRVIAWHPDSDTGPRNHDHPMLNRTIINGSPATPTRENRT